ncbi:hypothetical protein CLU79DRAFT_778176 [Phycomyces nitens]|nr:hypothetical protein CLU79DRAFT_778176 [Phycomyces nitens]
MAITVKIKPFTGDVLQVELDPESTTVVQFKSTIGQKMGGLEAIDIKLVYSGRILKDEDSCSTYGIKEGHTIYMVRSSAKKASSSTAKQSPTTANNTTTSPSNATTTTTTTTTTATSTSVSGSSTSTPRPNNPASAGLSPFGGLRNMFDGDGASMMDPEAMRQMMNSPMMQGILSNPEFVRSILMSNPQMKSLVEQNPEVGHMINDPAFLQQSMEMMRNPELLREMQRNNDRALSNIEALPGGFNHLQRMYSTIQGPLGSAMQPGAASSDEANQRMARELNVTSVPENQLNTQALPNPWATGTPNNAPNNSPAAPSNLSNPSSATPGANPFASLFGLSAPMFPFGGQQSTETPPTQPNPTNNSNGQMPLWADPSFLEAGMRMHQAMMNAQGQGQGQGQQQSMGMGGQGLWNMGGFPSFQPPQAAAENAEPPEVRFRSQIGQLEDMGFGDKQANIRALLATGGNVNSAVEYLLANN